MIQAAPHQEERHATWIELFFDLVLVAGVGQLAHLLTHGPTPADLGLYLLLYLAFWIVWAAFTVYGNVAGDNARIPAMLLAMLGLAVMVAAVPGVRDEHTRAFVIAYIFLRWYAGVVYGRGQIVVDWPLAQYGVGALPWLISLFTRDAARYWLWTLGIVLDLAAMLIPSGAAMLRTAERRLERAIRIRRLPVGQPVPTIQATHTASAHLSERLGLFVIIVLGEGVIQVLTAAGEAPWHLALDLTALGSFALLIGLWTLSLVHGFAGIPGLNPRTINTRHAMALHGGVTAAIAALAAGLGAAVAHADGTMPTDRRWLLCGSVAAYFVLKAVAGLLMRPNWRWMLGWAAPGILIPILLGLFGGPLRTSVLIWMLAATVGWQVLYPPSRQLAS